MLAQLRTLACVGFVLFVIPLNAQTDRHDLDANQPFRPALAVPRTSIPHTAVETEPSTFSAADQQFLEKAMRASLVRLEAGTLAWSKGSDGAIKQYGRRMYDEHSRMLREVQALAMKKAMSLYQAPDEEYEAKISRLSRAYGREFDQLYIKNSGMADYISAKQLFGQGVKSRDPDIHVFALKALSTIEEHLRMAQNLSKAI